MAGKLRWGVVGCAKIAVGSVIPAIQQSELCEVVAIASRSMDKATKTAANCGIERTYGSYEALIADPEVDAVYIPLPNHLHKEWTIRAAKAGKHILCEKPLALTAMEAQEMVDACRGAGVFLTEAFMYRYHPRYDRIREIIRTGEIGEIRALFGSFTFNNAADTGNVRAQQFMGGGSVYDVGCYPINAARYLLGREPEAVTALGFFSAEHDNVDMMASGMLEFPGDVALTFDCGMWAEFRNTLEIVGSEGRIEVPSAFLAPPDSSNFYVTAQGQRRMETAPNVNQYTLQADALARTVLGGEPLRFGPEDAVANMKVIDAVYHSMRNRVRVVL